MWRMWVRPKIIQPHENPGDYHGYCGGRDKNLDTKCTCPDPIYTLQIRLLRNELYYRHVKCACCDLEFDPAGTP